MQQIIRYLFVNSPASKLTAIFRLGVGLRLKIRLGLRLGLGLELGSELGFVLALALTTIIQVRVN